MRILLLDAVSAWDSRGCRRWLVGWRLLHVVNEVMCDSIMCTFVR